MKLKYTVFKLKVKSGSREMTGDDLRSIPDGIHTPSYRWAALQAQLLSGIFFSMLRGPFLIFPNQTSQFLCHVLSSFLVCSPIFGGRLST